jgi:glutamine amidotransferase
LIAIVDYGCGNLHSVAKAFEAIGEEAVATASPADLESAGAIVIPGVGAFASGMRNLLAAGVVECLQEQVIGRRKPVLGICLGMQLMAKQGREGQPTPGLGWVDGVVDRMPAARFGLHLPHVGWNEVVPVGESPLFEGLGRSPVFYFVHSYAVSFENCEGLVLGWADYGEPFVAALQSDNIVATQFHPEKSQGAGLRFLTNWVDSCL